MLNASERIARRERVPGAATLEVIEHRLLRCRSRVDVGGRHLATEAGPSTVVDEFSKAKAKVVAKVLRDQFVEAKRLREFFESRLPPCG